MSWKECLVLEDRYRFLVRLVEGEETSCPGPEFSILQRTSSNIVTGAKLWVLLRNRCRISGCHVRFALGTVHINGRFLTVNRRRARIGVLRLEQEPASE